MIGVTVDVINNNVWAYSARNLAGLNYLDENTNLWVAYVKKGKLQQALKLTEDTEHYPTVAGLLADQLFAKGNFKQAGKYYS